MTMTPDAARRAAEEIVEKWLGCGGMYQTEAVGQLEVLIATAIAQALDEQLESPLIAGCIEVVATLVKKGYGTSRADVVQGVENAIAQARAEERGRWAIVFAYLREARQHTARTEEHDARARAYPHAKTSNPAPTGG